MSKREVHYPHTIGFRVTDETWFRIKREIAETELTPQDWCREVVLEKLNEDNGLARSQRLIFNQVARTQYLVGLGFQLLAEDKLSPEEWKKLRSYAKNNLKVISTKVLEGDPF